MKGPLRKVKNDLIYYGSRTLIFFLGFLPYELVGRLGMGFGTLLFRLAGGERRRTLEGLQTAFGGELDEKEIERLALGVWSGLGRNLFEVARWLRMTPDGIVAQITRVQGAEHMEAVLERGKGAFVVTAHLGNWELMGGFLAARYPPAVAVAKKLYDSRFDDLITYLRTEKLRGTMIKRGFALRAILESLRKNLVIMALCDQDTGKDGVYVPFFGKEAWTQSGVARIARKTGAALVPAFAVRGKGGCFEVHFEKEIEVPRTTDAEADVVETVRRYTEVIESYVRAYPDQWMWMHPRWKTRPPGELKRGEAAVPGFPALKEVDRSAV